jgi:hypothetical protein
MAYIYRHIRLDKNEPFYIGIGSDQNYQRSKYKRNRNKHWNNIISITGYRVEILIDELSWGEACEKEKEFILLYGRKDLGTGILCNMTDGGEGSFGRKVSNKTMKALRMPKSDDVKRKISESQIGDKGNFYGRKHTEETKSKIRNYNIGRVMSDEAKMKMRLAKKGVHKRGLHPKSKKVLDISKGIVYNCIMDAAEALDISYSHAKRVLSSKTKNKLNIKLY